MARPRARDPAEPLTGIILAGGMGTRLGKTNKALLKIGGMTVIERLITAMKPLVQDFIIVANEPTLAEMTGLRLVGDVEPGAGSLMGLYSGLKAVHTPLAAALACDMPFISPALIRYLARRARHCDAVVPVVGGREEPLHAVLRPACLGAMERALVRGDKRIVSFLPEAKVVYVAEKTLRRYDRQLLSFFNINTPEDLARAELLCQTNTLRTSTGA